MITIQPLIGLDWRGTYVWCPYIEKKRKLRLEYDGIFENNALFAYDHRPYFIHFASSIFDRGYITFIWEYYR
jgi:hypothetical protein